MAKKEPQTEMLSYGRYTTWKPQSKELPKIRKFTTTIPARAGAEFGYILELRKARGLELSFTIEHPPIRNEEGELLPPFTGSETVPSNRYEFFLGDCVWEPVDEKVGTWRLITSIDGEVVADKSFDIVAAGEVEDDDV